MLFQYLKMLLSNRLFNKIQDKKEEATENLQPPLF